jgi:tripartite-type tricarboxylate transporter receptor subunit TctC
MRTLHKTVLFFVAAACALVSFGACADTYPNRPVRVVIPYASGGGADAAARLMTMGLTKALGQSFVVESRAGGNTAIGAVAVAHSAPDGYTLLMAGGTTMALNPMVVDKLPYDPLNDFAPISMLAYSPYLVAVSAEMGADSLADVLAQARAKPGTVAYASNGIGGTVHLGMEMLAQRAQVRFNHVPYKGFAPALPDLISGRTPVTMIDLASLGSFAKSGRVKVVAITSAQRSALFPDVPTIAELGFPGYAVETWFGLFAPAGTPPAIIATLSEAMQTWMALPETQDAIHMIGQEPKASTPDYMRQRIVTEQQMYAPLVKAANIKAE